MCMYDSKIPRIAHKLLEIEQESVETANFQVHKHCLAHPMPSLVSHSAQALEWETLVKVWLPRNDKVSKHTDTDGNHVNQKTNQTKNKELEQNKKNFWENVRFWLKGFWGFPQLFFVWNGKTKNSCVLFFVMDMINQDVKKPLAFQNVRRGFLHWEVSKATKDLEFFCFLISWLIIPMQKTKNNWFLFVHFKQ